MMAKESSPRNTTSKKTRGSFRDFRVVVARCAVLLCLCVSASLRPVFVDLRAVGDRLRQTGDVRRRGHGLTCKDEQKPQRRRDSETACRAMPGIATKHDGHEATTRSSRRVKDEVGSRQRHRD